MRKLTVINHVTLDGVMQAPARPDEDTRGGFGRGGWAQAGNDPAMADFMGVGRGGAPGPWSSAAAPTWTSTASGRTGRTTPTPRC
jgi:hypothetical protein